LCTADERDDEEQAQNDETGEPIVHVDP
jgi:hypothetical protein